MLRLNVTNAMVNYEEDTIDITRYTAVWPFIPEEVIYTFWPIVVSENRLIKEKTYRLRVWNGKEYSTIRRVKRKEEGGLVFVTG